LFCCDYASFALTYVIVLPYDHDVRIISDQRRQSDDRDPHVKNILEVSHGKMGLQDDYDGFEQDYTPR